MRSNRRLGQHFLNHPAAAGWMVDAAGITPDDLVVEIGPGRGALTDRLLRCAKQVVGIELDSALADFLRQRFKASPQLKILNQDVLQVDFSALMQNWGFEKAVLVGNLPYQITGAVVAQILDAWAVWKRAVLMVQREVGARMVAAPGGKDYGILSIAVQIRTHPRRLFDLKPRHFVPPPRVHSSVIQMDFSGDLPVEIAHEGFFFQVVRTAFQQRRKMLKNTLKGFVGNQMAVLEQVLENAEVHPNVRPEAVSGAQFEAISRALMAFSAEESEPDRSKGERIGTA